MTKQAKRRILRSRLKAPPKLKLNPPPGACHFKLPLADVPGLDVTEAIHNAMESSADFRIFWGLFLRENAQYIDRQWALPLHEVKAVAAYFMGVGAACAELG